MDINEFRHAVIEAKLGDEIVYHNGNLHYERLTNADLHVLAREVWEMAGMAWDKNWGQYGAWRQTGARLIQLVQRRIDRKRGFQYIAVRVRV